MGPLVLGWASRAPGLARRARHAGSYTAQGSAAGWRILGAMDASLAALFFVFATLGTLFLVIYWAVRLAIRHERGPREPREAGE